MRYTEAVSLVAMIGRCRRLFIGDHEEILCTVPLWYRSSLGLAAMFTHHLPKHLMRVPSLLVLRVHPRMRRRRALG